MKLKHLIILLLVIAIGIGIFFANRFIKTKYYDGLTDFIPSLISNATNTSPADDTLFVSMSDSAFQKISEIRDRALQTGVIINPEEPWVKGNIVFGGDTIKVSMRLKGKMTDHVKGDKWSYRIKTKKGKLIFGMHRFSIQHPGTRNYLYEWLHLYMARDLGMMALSYRFVRVYFNGKDLGIYAVEENFDKELPFNNRRALGPVFRFDPDAYWEYRLLGLRGFHLKPEYTGFQSSFIDPMRSWSVKDSVQRQYLEEALILMNAFREQKADASEVLDLDLFAKRYALLDLIGGFKSVDWSDLKFYYNPITKKIEPIAYESFSGFRIKGLIGFNQFQPDKKYHGDFHTLLFSDPAFYTLYYKYLQEFSQPEFIDGFLSENDSVIAQNIRVLNNEFPYKRFDRRVYDYNARVIQTLTHPKFPLHVFVKKDDANGKPRILKAGNVSALPVEVLGVWREDEFYPLEKQILAPKQSNGSVHYHQLIVNGLVDFKGAQLVYRLLGNEEEEQAEIFQYDRPSTESIGDYPVGAEQYFKKYTGILFDLNGNKAVFRPGEHTIDFPLVIPDSIELLGFAPLTLHFKGAGMIISKHSIELKGTEGNPVIVSSTDNSGGFVLLESNFESNFKHVIFRNVGVPSNDRFSYAAHINVYRTNLKLEHCLFENSELKMIAATDASVDISECIFSRVSSAIHGGFSEIKLSRCALSGVTGNAISIDACNATLNNVIVADCNKKALNVEKWSHVSVNTLKTTQCKTGIAVKSGSVLTLKKWQKQGNELDVDLKSKTGYGITKLSISNSGKAGNFVIEKDKESVLIINN